MSKSTRTVNIEVYCDNTGGERNLFAVLTEHRPDLPKPFDEQLQNWVQNEYSHLEIGDSVEQAGEMEYEPNGDIVEFRPSE